MCVTSESLASVMSSSYVKGEKESGEISELVSVSELALDSSRNVVRTLFSVDCGVCNL